MPFGDDEVQINYRAVVTGMQDVESLRAQNSGLQGETHAYTQKVNESTAAHVKNADALKKSAHEMGMMRREIHGLLIPIALVSVALTQMAKGNESAQMALDSMQNATVGFFGKIAQGYAYIGGIVAGLKNGLSLGDALENSVASEKQLKSIGTQVLIMQEQAKNISIQAQIYKTKGDEFNALKQKQASESLAIDAQIFALKKVNANKETDELRSTLIKRKSLMDEQHADEMEAYRLHSMGLKQQAETDSAFLKQVVGGTQQTSSNVLQNFLNGQKQSGMDIVNAFRANFNKAVSDAFTESLFAGKGFGGFFKNLTDIFTGKKPDDPIKAAIDKTTIAVKNNDEMLKLIRDCVCRTAAATEAMAACGCGDNARIVSATVTPGKESTWSKLAGITGAIGSIAGGLGALPGLGGVPTPINPGTMPPAGMAPLEGMMQTPVIPMDQMLRIDAQKLHSGGFVHQFPSGGEVPIMAQPGEFIVRKSVAQDNKEVLKSMNSGARQSKNAQNIYFINANDAKSFSDMLSSPSAQAAMEMQITRAVMNNGSLRDAIRSFGRG